MTQHRAVLPMSIENSPLKGYNIMTTFGEIAEPTSRSAWEDWEEIIDTDLISLQWKFNEEKPVNIETLIIVEGRFLTDYVEKQIQSELHQIDTIPEVNLKLCHINNTDKYVCFIMDYDLLKSSEIVEMLKNSIICSKNVIAIQNKPLPEYQVISPAQECAIRSISTTISKSNTDFPKLEQPNIISGVSAGAISLREHMNLSGSAFVCYMEYPDRYEIEDLRSLFHKLDMHQKVSSDTFNVISSNLYI